MRNCFDQDAFGDRMLAYSGAKVQTCFYPGDLVTCTGDWKIRSVSGRLGMSIEGYFFQGGAVNIIIFMLL